MKNSAKCLAKFAAGLLFTCSIATAGPGTVHTWHTVSASDGTWNAKLQMINQGGFFVAPGGIAINDFSIAPTHSQDYGFGYLPGSDFDIAYTLTLVQEKSNSLTRFTSKACVFVITAFAPAKPDVRISSFNGAKCETKFVQGRGQDFMVG